MRSFSKAARLYVISLVLAAYAILFVSFRAAFATQSAIVIALVLAGVASSALKVTLPGINSTLSVNYIFILISASVCGCAETVVVGVAAALAQVVLRSKTRPRPVHIVFNVAAAIVTSATCSAVYRIAEATVLDSIPVLFLVTSAAYYVVNTATIAGIVTLTEHRSLPEVWKQNYLWTAPQYLVGAAIAAAFTAVGRAIGWQWALLVAPAAYITYSSYRLYLGRVETERRHATEISELHLRTIEALAVAIDAKDETTHDHLRRVQVYTVEVGKELGLNDTDLQALKAAALLHDIGKLAVPEYILSKPGRLTPEEFERIKVHPLVGAEILERVRFPYPVVPIVAAHHEKWDGSGYPNGLKSEEIPIGARILSAVDCLDALASERQYRRALPLDDAMASIVAQSGKSFDPQVVEVLRKRYHELEKMARAVKVESAGLSKDVRIARGESPDAGFAGSSAEQPPQPPQQNFIASIAAARQEFQTLHELTTALGASLSMESTLSLVAGHLRDIVPYDTVAVYLTGGGVLTPEYVSGADRDLFASMRIPIGQGLSGWVVETGKSILNGNPSVEPGYLQDPAKFSILKSAVSVPLTGADGVIGALTLYSRSKDNFTRDHLRLLNAVTSKAAITIQNSRALQEARKSATTDALTGLANTRGLFLQFDAELSRAGRAGTPLSVVVLDLDGFKQVNDRFGHLAGNQVLQCVAEKLRQLCRPSDVLARMGGDEFVAVLPGLDGEALAARCVEFARAVEEAGILSTGERVISTSTGCATLPEDGEDAEDLLAAADRRMYAMKHSSRQRQDKPGLDLVHSA